MSSDHLDDRSDLSRTESVIAGGLAGLLSRFVISPLDVLKIRLQLDTARVPSGAWREPVVWGTAKQLLVKEGITAFWKGNVPAELMYVLYGASQFSAYKLAVELTQRELQSLSTNTQHFIAGASAGCAATLATYPLDLLRTRLASDTDRSIRRRLAGTVTDILAQEGPRGLYRGLKPAVASIVPSMGVFFLVYEEIRRVLQASPQLDAMPAPEVVAGLVAGGISKASVFPLDVVRKRLQVQGIQGRQMYPPTILGTARSIAVHEGVRGLYKGFMVSILKTAPASAVTMFFFEKSIIALRWFEHIGQKLTP